MSEAGPQFLQLRLIGRHELGIALLDKYGAIIKGYGSCATLFYPDGDYIDLKIDIATGHIIDWIPPTTEDLRHFLNGEHKTWQNEFI